MATANGARSYALELAITAPDRAASSTLRTIGDLVTNIGKAAAGSLNPINALGSSLIRSLTPAEGLLNSLINPFALLSSSAGLAVSAVSGLTGGFSSLKQSIDEVQGNPALSIALQSILAEADAEIDNLDNRLTSVLSSVKDVGGLLAKGAVTGGKRSTQKAPLATTNKEEIQSQPSNARVEQEPQTSISTAQQKSAFQAIEATGIAAAGQVSAAFGGIGQTVSSTLNQVNFQAIEATGIAAAGQVSVAFGGIGKSLNATLNQVNFQNIEAVGVAAAGQVSVAFGGIGQSIGSTLNQVNFQNIEATGIAAAGQVSAAFGGIGKSLNATLNQVNFQNIEATGAVAAGQVSVAFGGIGKSLNATLNQVNFQNIEATGAVAAGQVSAAFGSIGQSISSTLNQVNFQNIEATGIAAAGQVSVAFGGIRQSISSTLNQVNFQNIEATGVAAAGQVSAAFGGIGQSISQVFSGNLQSIQAASVTTAGQISAAFSGIGQSISQVFSGKLQTIETTGVATAGQVSAAFSGIGQSVDVALNQVDFKGTEAAGVATAGQVSAAFSGIGQSLGSALNQVDVIVDKVLLKAEKVPQRIAGVAGEAANILGGIAGFGEPLEVFDHIRTAVGATTSSMFALTQEIGFFTSGLQAMQQLVAAGPFNLLIQQNVELQEQLLSTKASLASTNDILQDGTKIADPTKAIQSLEGPVNAAIARIRQGSLDLVGVTSNDLVPVFQIIAGQSSQIGINLNQSADLALSAAAALGTIGLPLNQARQEITSLVNGTIDMNSVLAKSLGITNQMVNTWRSQGKVYEELTARLSAFRAGNALAAQTINGVFSNIQEIVDEIGRLAGVQLLDPIVKQLNVVYDYFKLNKDALAGYLTDIVSTLLKGVQAAVDAIGEIFNAVDDIVGQIPDFLVTSLTNFLVEGAAAVKSFIAAVKPLLVMFAGLAQSAAGLGGPFLKAFLTLKTLELGTKTLAGSFGILGQLVPGLGELFFFLSGRNSSLIRSFTGLRSELGLGAAGFLFMGKNLASIPGLAGLLAKQIPIFGNAVAANTPAVATLAIQLLGLSKAYPQVGVAMQNIIKLAPDAAKALSLSPLGQAAEKILPGFNAQLKTGTDLLGKYSDKATVASVANGKFTSLMEMLGNFLSKSALEFAGLGLGVYVAIQAFDRFILKNEALKEALLAIFQGLQATIGSFFSIIGTVLGTVINAINGVINAAKAFAGLPTKPVKDFGTAINDFLLNPVVLATGAMIGLVMAGEKLAVLEGGLKALQLTSMATGAVQASVGFQALKLAMTEGTAASAAYLATNGINVATLGVMRIQVEANVLAMRAFIIEKVRAAIAMSREFIAACVRAIVSLRTLRLSTLTSALSFVGLGTSATGAGTALNFVALKAKMSGIFAALTAAVSAGSAGFLTLATSIWTAVAGMAALLAPLAILVGALATIGLIAYTAILKDSTKATEAYGEQTALLSNESLKLGQRLKKATADQEERVKNGIRLSDEEYKANQRLQAQTKAQIKALDEKAATLKKAQDEAKGEGNKNAIGAQIAELARQKQLLEGLAGNIQIQAKDLPRLGTAYEQFAQEVNTALKALERPSGDPEIFKKQAQTLLEGTEAQLKAGLISAEQATRRYELLANNAALDKDTQIKAQQAITEASKIEGDRQTENVQAKQETVQALQESGRLSEAEGERQLTVLKGQELDIRLEALKKAKAQEDKIRADDLSKQLTQIDKQIADAQKAAAAAAGDPVAIKAANDQQVTSLKEGREKVLTQITQTEEQITALKAEAASKKGKDSDEAYNKAVDLQRTVDGLKRDLGTIDGQLKTAEVTASQPVKAGQKDEKALKAAQDSVTTLQQQRQQVQSQFESASVESSRKFNNQQSKIDADRQKNDAKALKQAYEQKLKGQDEEQQILEGRYAKGLVGEQAFNDKSLAITQARLDVELAEVKRQRALLASTDKEGLHKLEAQEQQINKRREEAQEKYQQQQIDILERAQRKALEVSKQAEAERDLEIQKFLSSSVLDRSLREAKAEEDRAKAKQASLEVELNAAKKFEAELERLPKFNNPVKEEERQSKIRGAKLKTTQISSQLLENQRQAEDAHTKFLQQQIEKRAKAEENAINNQLQIQEQLNKSLERKNKILETGKELQAAVSGYVDGEYKLAERLAANETKKRKIQEAAARARLAFLDQEIKYERLGVELENAKNKALIEREKLQNKLEQSRAKAEVSKVNANPDATDEEKEAAFQRVATSEYEALILDQSAKDEEKAGKLRLQKVDLQGNLKRDGARADLAEITRTKRDDRALGKEFLNKARSKSVADATDPELEQSAKSKLPTYEEFLKQRRNGTQPGAVNPDPTADPTQVKPVTQRSLGKDGKAAQSTAQQVSRQGLTPPPVPTLPRSAVPANAVASTISSELFGVANKILSLLDQRLGAMPQTGGGDTNLYNTFNQYFTKGDVQAGGFAKSVEQVTLNTLFGVGQTAKQQRGRLKPS